MRAPTLAALLLATACTSGPADQARAILPDDRLLIDESGFSDLARGLGEPSEAYALTWDVTREVNGGLGEVLALVEAIASFDPTWSDDEDLALWGPWEDGGVWGQMWVQGTGATGWRWAIEVRADGTPEDAWQPALAGEVDPGGTEETSSGRFVMDFTAIEAAGGDDGVTGAMSAEYALRADGAEAEVAFGEISTDGSVPQDAAYRYDHTIGAGGAMDVAITEDVSDPANGVLELLVIRSRWDGAGAGRTDAVVTGGDLGALSYTESECWDAAHLTVWLENNFELVREGDESACAFAEAEFPGAR